LGKRVYMRQELTSTMSLKDDGLKVFDLNEITLEKDFVEKDENILLVKELFSQDRLIACLRRIWES